jgi:hypothetical protein
MDTSQYYNQIAGIYDPQRAIIAQQRAALEPAMQSQISALEQAKINAYRDIGTTARARGMQFSGFSPEQEARYTGATYLPALANVKAQYAAGMTSLDKALADIATAQGTQALNLYQGEKTYQRQQETQQKEFDWKAAQAELDRQANLRIANARASSSSSSSSSEPSTMSVKRQLQQDINNAYQNAAAQKPSDAYYTEKVILPTLYENYGELGYDYINKQVYEYRKAKYGY